MTEEIRRLLPTLPVPEDDENNTYQCKESRSHGTHRKPKLSINGRSKGDFRMSL